MAISQDLYIPVGSICIGKEDISLNPDQWGSLASKSWTFLNLYWQDDQYGAGIQQDSLDADTQQAILKTPALTSAGRLLRVQWINLEARFFNNAHFVVRVHMLPDDVLRSSLDRSSPNHIKARAQLIQNLEYSPDVWNGTFKPDSLGLTEPLPADGSISQEHGQETSLLELFNSIPSPNPNSELLNEPTDREAMLDLLASTVAGLKTELYPYQRRSAALMLQKEVQPGHVLDPRLRHVKDQGISTWYLDPVSGSVLREPRYYDGVNGGVLAEEMGSGKTIICLALILATKELPCPPPSVYGIAAAPTRPTIGSLMDMAASSITRNAVPWKPYMAGYSRESRYEFSNCAEAIDRNPGFYHIPPDRPMRMLRHVKELDPPKRILLSSATIIVVPNNLLAQWNQEIRKHTESLRVMVVVKDDEIPAASTIMEFDIILFSQSRFESIVTWHGGVANTPLAEVHFKRCIVDEGHKLGNSRMGNRSNLLLGLDALHITSRWIVTGTPSQGLFGVEKQESQAENKVEASGAGEKSPTPEVDKISADMEKKDLERIGAITALYLKARPWANTIMDTEDTRADWTVYLMLPRHNKKSRGHWDCLKSTLNSLILRHPLVEVRDLLPPVNEKTVLLDGSYQDRLSLNIFSMMIIFNSVQSQRTDQDYFFHQKQRRALLQIVSNLKQASFFGGSFFSPKEIEKAVGTAEGFLKEGKVAISSEDESLLKVAIEFGHLAMTNALRNLTNMFHEMPVTVKNFPGGAGETWSLDGAAREDVCTCSSLLLALQKLIYKNAPHPEKLNALLNGSLVQEGRIERAKLLQATEADSQDTSAAKDPNKATLAGNTKMGGDTAKKQKSHGVNGFKPKQEINEALVSGPLQLTQISSTVSAKLSYLIDGIVQHSRDEKIIVFYENENIAWYLASMLDVVSFTLHPRTKRWLQTN